jgi:hypothetical protein
MALKRTIKISSLVDRINHFLNLPIEQDRKIGLALLLESILHDADSYRGYGYLQKLDSPDFQEYNRQYYYR